MRSPAWRIALSLFTVIPVGADGELGPGDGARAVRWLPAVGLLLGLAGCALSSASAPSTGQAPDGRSARRWPSRWSRS